MGVRLDEVSSVDSGYSWIVCFSSFLVNVISDGILFSFGVYYIELRDYFQASDSQTAWAGSLLLGLELLAGPFVSVLVNRFGCRAVTMAGGFISAAGLFCGSFATSIVQLIVCYGVIGGIGLSMLYIPSLMVVSLYFEKRRALANGIAMCGAGVGTIVFAFLLMWLLEEYTWRNILQILAGLLMQCVVFGAFYRPLGTSDNVSDSPTASSDAGSSTQASKSSLHKQSEWLKSQDSIKKIPQIVVSRQQDEVIISQKEGELDVDFEPHTRERSSTFTNNIGNLRKDIHALLINNDTLKADVAPSSFKSAPALHVTSANRLNQRHHLKLPNFGSSYQRHHQSSLQPLDHKDIFYSGSLMRIPNHIEAPSSAMSLASLDSHMDRDSCCSKRCSFLGTLRYLIDCSLMVNKSFLVLVLSCTLWTGQAVIFTYVAPLAVSIGIPLQMVSWLYSAIGLSNVVGRILCGWITDHPCVNSVRLYSGALLGAGVVSMIMPFSTNFTVLISLCTLFGLCMAFYVSLRTIVLVDVLGIDRLTNSFGILVMFQGVGFTLTPPAAGLFVDATSSYISPFVMVGVFFMFAGVMCFPLKTLPTLPPDMTSPREEVDVVSLPGSRTISPEV